MNKTLLHQTVLCIGAGPACLTAAYDLSKHGVPVTVLEQDATYVGGISRTEQYKGFRFDVGGHRFFSKSAEIEDLWTEILGGDLIDRPRRSHIYYKGKLFDYPLRAFNALSNLGLIEASLCMLSYLKVRVHPLQQPRNFEEWVTNQFGARLFRIFFKTYTEKVWGMKCADISADWAAQRIKGLSLASAIWHSLLPQRGTKSHEGVIKTLISSFRYPRLGPGMMWETAAQKIEAAGGKVLMDRRVTSVSYDPVSRQWTAVARDAAGESYTFTAAHVISSTSMRELIGAFSPPPAPEVVRAASSLRYRDFLTVALILKDKNRFDDNWIYIHDPSVQVGRIQNFKSWSPELVPEPLLNCYGLEYFCFEGDDLWTAPDEKLVALGRDELVKLGLAAREDVIDGRVIRQPKAYPVYDDVYSDHVAVIREALEKNYPNMHLVGRNGMHKYNNQDHAMMTGLLVARNIREGASFDVWAVNQDAEYHEAGAQGQEHSFAEQAA